MKQMIKKTAVTSNLLVLCVLESYMIKNSMSILNAKSTAILSHLFMVMMYIFFAESNHNIKAMHLL